MGVLRFGVGWCGRLEDSLVDERHVLLPRALVRVGTEQSLQLTLRLFTPPLGTPARSKHRAQLIN